MLSGTIMLPRAVLMVVLGMAGIGEDTVQDGWECGVGGLEGGWIEKSGRLAEKTVGSDSRQKMGPVRDHCPNCGM